MLTSMLLAAPAWHDPGYWHHHHGWGPWFIVPLLWLIAIVVLVTWLVRRRGSGRPNGMSVLAERFARGEIDEAEFNARRAVLRGRRRRGDDA